MDKPLSSNVRAVLIGFLLLGFFLFYSGAFFSLAKQWRSNEIYSHGFLVPFISLYLLALQRGRIDGVQMGPNYRIGIPAVLVSQLCLLIGRVAGVVVLEEISIVLFICGLIVLLFGKSFFRAVWFPITYLLLMIPMWDLFTERMQLPFQLLSASIGVKILNWIGIPIFHNGTFLEIPGITLEVAQACSGLNYLVSVLAIGIPLSYIYMKRWWKRLFVLLFSAVVAIISNGVRVALVGLFAYSGNFGKYSDIHGPLHIFQALSVSFVGYIVIFLCVWMLKDATPQYPVKRQILLSTGKRVFESLRVYPLAFGVLILGAFGGLTNLYPSSSSPPKKDFAAFPYVVGDWSGGEVEPEMAIYQATGVDHELSRIYFSDYLPPLRFYVGYYESQRQGKEVVNYQNDNLFNEAKSVEVRLDSGDMIEINTLVTNHNNKTILYLYWIQENNYLLLNKFSEKYHTALNAFLNRKTNAAIVIVSMDVGNGIELEEVLKAEKKFVRLIYPLLKDYVP